jgi:hypothetical protein
MLATYDQVLTAIGEALRPRPAKPERDKNRAA